MDKKCHNFFTKVNQQFYFCKKVLESCETIDQMSTASDWVNRVSDNWDRELDKIADTMSTFHAVDARIEYRDRLELMRNEWDAKINEMLPPQTGNQFTVKGFNG